MKLYLNKLRFLLVVLFIILGVVVIFFKSTVFVTGLPALYSMPALGLIIYFLLSCLRGFTLIPATYFVLGGMAFFPPKILFAVSLIAVIISSFLIYYFAESFRVFKFFEKRHARQITKIKSRFETAEVPVVIGWILMPAVPSDVVCYVCGILKANKKKMLVGILVGEGIYFALLIFFGVELIKFFK